MQISVDEHPASKTTKTKKYNHLYTISIIYHQHMDINLTSSIQAGDIYI